MYTVHTGGRKAGREVVVVEMKGRFVGGASLSFIQWMARRVPSQQLRPEQQALVKWYEEHSDHEAA